MRNSKQLKLKSNKNLLKASNKHKNTHTNTYTHTKKSKKS